jgi:outer membrane protein TolC
MSGCRMFILFLLVFIVPGAVQALQKPASVLSLDQCIALALERHPLIRSSQYRHEASLARIKQVTAYPTPSVDFVSDLQPVFLDFVNSQEAYLGVSQTFELPRKRVERGRIAQQEANEAETDIDLVKLEVVFQVRSAFYRLLLSMEKLEYAKRDMALTEDYLKKAELKLAAGDVGRVEVLRARVESLKGANAVKLAAKDLDISRMLLNYHLARVKDEPLQVEGRLESQFIDLNLHKLQEDALTLRPELRKLQFSVQREMHVQQSARLNSLPDLDLNASIHRVENEPTTWSFTVSVPLPFLFKQRQNAEIAESVASIGAYRMEADQARNAVLTEVEEAYRDTQMAKEDIVLYRDEILPQAQEVYDMFLFSYQEGEIGGIELIEARRTLNESRRFYADALFEYNIALAALERAVGRMP